MQHSLESRTVFFSPEVLAASASCPDNCLVNGSVTKKVLRRLAVELLPSAIASAPKRGFEPPLEHIVDIELAPLIHEYLLGQAPEISELLGKTKLQQIIERRTKMSGDRRARILYAVFALAYWLRHRPVCEVFET
jgi:asparagine synthase (glutamine-hydrolysing)